MNLSFFGLDYATKPETKNIFIFCRSFPYEISIIMINIFFEYFPKTHLSSETQTIVREDMKAAIHGNVFIKLKV